MKTTVLFVMLLAFFYLPQAIYAQCIQCEGGSASGTNASIIGLDNTAEGDNSFAGGINSIASGFTTFAFGNQAEALGNYSFAFGPSAKAGTSGSNFAIGMFIEASGYQSFVIGNGQGQTNIFTNNIHNSMMLGTNSNLPTLFLQGAPGAGYTGKVGIGNVTEPLAKLHIKADITDVASIMIEPAIASESSYLYMGNSKNFGIKQTASRLEFLADDKFIFYEGNIGIGTYTPAERLEIAGNIKQHEGFHITTDKIVSSGGNGLKLYSSAQTGILVNQEGLVGFGTDEPQAKVHVKSGDIFIDDINHGIIMKSPDGNCWRGTLDNSGTLQFEPVNCDDLAGTQENIPAGGKKVILYPNPAGDRLFVEVAAEFTGSVLEILNMSGTSVFSAPVNQTETYIEMSDFAPGTYMVKLTDGSGKLVETSKVIKQ